MLKVYKNIIHSATKRKDFCSMTRNSLIKKNSGVRYTSINIGEREFFYLSFY